MEITCISDLHGHLPVMYGGDLLIVAGDITASNKVLQWMNFFDWLQDQCYEKKILIGGNHDGFLEECLNSNDAELMGIREDYDFDYLCDSGTTYQGLKIWGSPWTPAFCDWHFMKYTADELKQVWDKIPMDTDILVTHGPPYGVLDHVELSSRGDVFKHAGCHELLKAVDRVKPGLHCFGHIHENGGHNLLYKHPGSNTLCVNASIMDRDYRPTNSPVYLKYGPIGSYLNLQFTVNESKVGKTPNE